MFSYESYCVYDVLRIKLYDLHFLQQKIDE